MIVDQSTNVISIQRTIYLECIFLWEYENSPHPQPSQHFVYLTDRNIDDEFNVGDRMSDLKDLLSRMGKSDEIKSYFNKINDSLVLIKRCVFVLVFLAVLMVIISVLL